MCRPLIIPLIRAIFPTTVSSFDMYMSLVDAWEVNEVGDTYRFLAFPLTLKWYLSINQRTDKLKTT